MIEKHCQNILDSISIIKSTNSDQSVDQATALKILSKCAKSFSSLGEFTHLLIELNKRQAKMSVSISHDSAHQEVPVEFVFVNSNNHVNMANIFDRDLADPLVISPSDKRKRSSSSSCCKSSENENSPRATHENSSCASDYEINDQELYADGNISPDHNDDTNSHDRPSGPITANLELEAMSNLPVDQLDGTDMTDDPANLSKNEESASTGAKRKQNSQVADINLETNEIQASKKVSRNTNRDSYYKNQSGCLLCKLTIGRNSSLSKHYMKEHPESEMLFARPSPAMAQKLRNQSDCFTLDANKKNDRNLLLLRGDQVSEEK